MRKTILAVTGLALVVGSCSTYDSSPIIVGRKAVAAIALSLPSQPLVTGQTQRATATPQDANGAPLLDRPITWQSSLPAVAVVNDSGSISAVAAGATIISASSEGVTAQGTLTVLAPSPVPVTTVSVTPSSLSLLVGGTLQLAATTSDANGNVLTGRAIAWSSANAGVASISASGFVTAVAVGSTTLTASSEGQSGTATVTVSAVAPVPVASVTVSPATSNTQVGGTVQLSAVMRDANGNVLTGRALVWASANTGIATISTAGLVTAVAAGSTTLTATSEGQSGTATVTVAAPIPVSSVTVSPATSNIQVGGTVQLSAVTRDANGNVLTGRAVTWASANPGFATVSTSGLVTAVSAGTATISATSEGRVGTATVVVAAAGPAPVATVTVTPATSSLQIGGTVQLSAVTRDASGNVLTGRSIVWASSSPSIASVTTTGLVTAIAGGTATVSATSEGRSGTSTISVGSSSGGSVGSVNISFAKTVLAIGEQTQAMATVRDLSGGVVTGRAITWQSANPSVATVSSAGVVTAVALGTVTITGTAGGVAGQDDVAVGTAPVQIPAPEPDASSVVIFQDNFDKSSLTALTSGYATRGDLALVTDGHAGQAIRFLYSNNSSDNLIEKNFGGAYQDIYFRYWYRTSIGADPTCSGRGGLGMKWFMPWRASTYVRYTMGVGNLSNGPNGRENLGLEFSTHDNTSTREPGPFLSNVNNTIRLSTTNDGRWHEYTLHVVTDTGAGWGYEQIWVDGTLLLDNTAFKYDHDPSGIGMVQFPGVVVNWFSGCDFTIDVDDFVVWHK